MSHRPQRYNPHTETLFIHKTECVQRVGDLLYTEPPFTSYSVQFSCERCGLCIETMVMSTKSCICCGLGLTRLSYGVERP